MQQVFVGVNISGLIWLTLAVQSKIYSALMVPFLAALISLLLLRPCMLTAILTLPHAVAAGVYLDLQFAVPWVNTMNHAAEYTVAAGLTLMAVSDMERDYREKTSLLMRREIDTASGLSQAEMSKRMDRVYKIHTFKLIEAEFSCRHEKDVETAVTKRLADDSSMHWSTLFFGTYEFDDPDDENTFDAFAATDSLEHFQSSIPQILVVECVMTLFAIYPSFNTTTIISIWCILVPFWGFMWMLSRRQGNIVQRHPMPCLCICFVLYASIKIFCFYYFLSQPNTGDPHLDRLALNEGVFPLIMLIFMALADLGLSGPQAWCVSILTHGIHHVCHAYAEQATGVQFVREGTASGSYGHSYLLKNFVLLFLLGTMVTVLDCFNRRLNFMLAVLLDASESRARVKDDIALVNEGKSNDVQSAFMRALNLFQEIDADGSGELDKAELKQLIVQMAPETALAQKSDAWFDGVFKQYDTDESGSFTFDEFLGIYNDLGVPGMPALQYHKDASSSVI